MHYEILCIMTFMHYENFNWVLAGPQTADLSHVLKKARLQYRSSTKVKRV